MEAGKSSGKSGVFFVVLYLVILIGFFVPFITAIISVMGINAGSEIEYEKDPLKLRKVELINRGDSWREYEISEGYTLCEVIITYENSSWYTAEYAKRPEYYGIYQGEEEYLGSAWLNSSSEFSYEVTDDNPIPAGKTGCRRYYVELWDGMTTVIVRETSDKLEGGRAEVKLDIPEGEWISVATTIYEE